MKPTLTGIGDIALYIPRAEMKLSELVSRRAAEKPELETHLKRAQETTGQERFRFPSFWEDTATLAAEAARSLTARMRSEQLRSLRFLASGTETSVDHSKPVSAYVQGMLHQIQAGVPESIASYQVQHACAGGALAAITVGSVLALNPERRESGIVVCSDIARYQTSTTAEVTQGSGAAALLVETNPRLLSLDLDTQGFHSRDVDDFFRPLGAVTASVRGGYSMKCYVESMHAALADHARRSGVDAATVLRETDLFVLHAPFRNMPVVAMNRILGDVLGYSAQDSADFLESRGFSAAIDPVSRIGNTYTASLFVSLAFLLADRFRVLGRAIAGKKVLLVSYGSGNTMAVISGTVSPDAPAVIASWDLSTVWRAAQAASMSEYDEWLDRPNMNTTYNTVLSGKEIPVGAFYLESIRSDGYRIYRAQAHA